MSIEVHSTDLDHPVGGDIFFLQHYSHFTVLFDHILGVLKAAELEVFEMVLGADDTKDVALQ